MIFSNRPLSTLFRSQDRRDLILRLVASLTVFAGICFYAYTWLDVGYVQPVEFVAGTSPWTPSTAPEQASPVVLTSVPVPQASSSSDSHSSSPSRVPSSSIALGSTLSVGERLDSAAPNLTSPSGQFILTLAPSGGLTLRDAFRDQSLFTTDTEFHWPVSWALHLDSDAILRLEWHHDTEAPFHSVVWTSEHSPDCLAPKTTAAGAPPVLQLLDTGTLQIVAGGSTVCTLHQGKTATDKGRLAIVYAGFLRTYLTTCQGHNEKFVKTWSGTGGVDVHVYA
jgi:hypothetical protein